TPSKPAGPPCSNTSPCTRRPRTRHPTPTRPVPNTPTPPTSPPPPAAPASTSPTASTPCCTTSSNSPPDSTDRARRRWSTAHQGVGSGEPGLALIEVAQRGQVQACGHALDEGPGGHPVHVHLQPERQAPDEFPVPSPPRTGPLVLLELIDDELVIAQSDCGVVLRFAAEAIRVDERELRSTTQDVGGVRVTVSDHLRGRWRRGQLP